MLIFFPDNIPADGSKSPLLYDPVYSTYVDEMTGAEGTLHDNFDVCNEFIIPYYYSDF